VPFVVGVDARAGVRVAPGEADALAVESRAGVPGGGGFLAVVDMSGEWCAKEMSCSCLDLGRGAE
jgi:hypothetical protein